MLAEVVIERNLDDLLWSIRNRLEILAESAVVLHIADNITAIEEPITGSCTNGLQVRI
jgi:hypothetical protein